METDSNYRAVLDAMGYKPGYIDQGIEILSRVNTVDGLQNEFNDRKFNCDEYQFLLPLFRPLYQADEEVKKTTITQLEPTGVPTTLINEYLTTMGDCPYLVLRLNGSAEKLGDEVTDKFIEETKRVMFETLKQKLVSSPN